MAAPSLISNVGSQLDRAIVAWLVSQNCGYVTATQAAQILPANSAETKVYPCITVHSQQSKNQPQFVGNKQFSVRIKIDQSAVVAPGADAQLNRVILDQLVGQVAYQMLQCNDGQTLALTCANITAAGIALFASDAIHNPDMANFAVQQLWDMGQTRGEPSEEGAAWVEVLNFEAVANPIIIIP